MKRNLLLLAALLAGVFAFSQPTLSLRGFKQLVFPGTVPVGISKEEGSSARVTRGPAANYFLYLSHPKGETIQPLQLWINKKAYTLSVEAVGPTPIEHTNRNIPARPVKTVLVPRTTHKVVRLVPQREATTNLSMPSSARQLVASSELVVSYKWKGKTYYKALKTLTELDPEMAE
jgi:hypothetical protein